MAPKRHVSDGAGPSTKKTRFAENPVSSTARISAPPPNDDEDEGLSGDAFSNKILEELEESGKGRKKQRVKTEGYESDSSDDGEGVVESRKKSRKKGDDDDDLDMFGEDEDKSDTEATSAKKKPIKFMNLGDIEGQEFGAGQGSGGESDEEPEDEDDAIRRSKKGMGFELSSFNMKDEMEEGKFAEDGTFVRSFDPHQVHDRWMEGLGDDEIKKARRSRKKMEEKEKDRQRKQDEEEGLAGKSKEQLELELLDWVKPGESVLQTLARLGAEKKKNDKSNSKRKGKNAKHAPDDEFDPGAEHRGQHPETSAIDRVTALASTLMGLGNLHIYDETHRTLTFNVREAGLVPQDWVPPSAVAPKPPPPPPESTTNYQYRWSPEYLASTPGGANPGEIFGPFGKDELLAWNGAAYFGPTGDRVQLRKLGDEVWSDWSIVV